MEIHPMVSLLRNDVVGRGRGGEGWGEYRG